LCEEYFSDRLFASSVWLEVEADVNSGVIFITYQLKYPALLGTQDKVKEFE
jgi:hypothetical protein